ncbi:MAG: tRNA (guanosine(37)-N1)-methyltransferase TrmD [Nitrospiria bacterium]
MKIDVVTLFPGMVMPVIQESMMKRAQENGLVMIRVHHLRDYTRNKHRVADDSPYGGGAGMVLKAEPIFAAIDAIQAEGDELRILLASPQGRVFDHRWAEELSREPRRLVLLCGHYEGIDERVKIGLPVEEFSIGDYVLTGGELAALVVLDSVVRLVPGVLGDPNSAREESFSEDLLEYPHYTRPAVFRGMTVPDVLLSGNHAQIARWRRQQSLRLTLKRRPDLLAKAVRLKRITEEDKKLLEEVI